MGFLKNGNSDNHLALVSSLIFGFIVFYKGRGVAKKSQNGQFKSF